LRIGQLFHLTPLVDDLDAAVAFYDAVFGPLCTYRGYSSHWHRDAAILVMADTVVEPMQPYPPADGEQGTSWFRYIDRFGPRVHNMAFYVEGRSELARRLHDAGVRTTDGGVGANVFTYPKQTPGMLEFFEPGEYRANDPRLSPHWPALRDHYWPHIHPLGLVRLSHLTVVVADRVGAARFYADVLDAVALPEQEATVPGATSSFVLVGEDTILELAQPVDAACPIAADLEAVGDCVTGATFTVRDLGAAARHLAMADAPVASQGDDRIELDRARTWNLAHTFTEAVLVGDPRADRG